MSTRNALPPVFVNKSAFLLVLVDGRRLGAELNVRRTLHKLRRKIVRLNMYVSVHSIVTIDETENPRYKSTNTTKITIDRNEKQFT